MRTVVLHDRVEPPLTAGDYEVRASQSVSGDPNLGTVPDDVRHVRVTGPRYRLPGTEVLSTFPPPDGDGPFSTRLAQVALRRRTLPWERADGPQRPWLALVLLSDGEGRFLPSVAVESAVTDGVRLTGPHSDGATCAAVEVPSRVVRQVFPSRQDLPFTCHVRQVPLDDTELAQGDDDGWVAVVLGTRLPRPGMRYRACLVNLEGQWNELADNPQTEAGIGKTLVYDTVSVATLTAARQPRSDGVPLQVGGAAATRTEGLARKRARDGIDREQVENALPPAGTGHAAADAWAAPTATGGSAAGALAGAAGLAAPSMTTAVGMGLGSVILDVSYAVLDPGARLLRFPVLMSWEFRCEGDKDFAALVQGLDVGLLGTAARPGRGPTDRVPEVAETGHVVLQGSDRTGEQTSSWYRGPLVPRAVTRRDPAAVHVSDQLRRVAEDGRAEIGEAAAFELGRLLALSSPSTVAALREWRARGFTARRAGTVGAESVLGGLLGTWGLLADGVLVADRFAAELGRTLLSTVGAQGVVESLLPARPSVDPLPDLEILRDPAKTIAVGLDVPLRALRAAMAGGARPEVTPDMLGAVPQVGFDALARNPELLAPLTAGLGARVREITEVIDRFPGRAGPLAPHGRAGDERGGDDGGGDAAAGDAATGEVEEADTVEGLFPGARPMSDGPTDGARQ